VCGYGFYGKFSSLTPIRWNVEEDTVTVDFPYGHTTRVQPQPDYLLSKMKISTGGENYTIDKHIEKFGWQFETGPYSMNCINRANYGLNVCDSGYYAYMEVFTVINIIPDKTSGLLLFKYIELSVQESIKKFILKTKNQLVDFVI
jgi:hypothetical protein